MFEDIGRKLKGLARFLCWGGIIGSVISGIVLFDTERPLTSLIIIVSGSLGSWISSWVTYAIGEIAENTTAIYKATKSIDAVCNNEKEVAEKKRIESVLKATAKKSPTAHYCPHCGEIVKSNTCDMCGFKNNLF